MVKYFVLGIKRQGKCELFSKETLDTAIAKDNGEYKYLSVLRVDNDSTTGDITRVDECYTHNYTKNLKEY